MITPGNLLLRWVSECGAGQLGDLLDAIKWTARTYGLLPAASAPGRWIRDAAAMGFLEVKWAEGRWCAIPPILTRLPKADGLLLLTGSRTTALAEKVREVAESDVELIEVPHHASPKDIPCPDALLIYDERGLDLGNLAKRLGATYVPCLATQLAGRVAPIELGPEAAPPARGMPLERFVISSKTFGSVEKATSEGLYRLERADHKRPYQIFCGGNWYQVSYEEGIFLEIAHDPSGERDHVRWKPEDDDQRDDMGQLIVDWGTPLPPAQRRMATLCSGLTPIFAEVTDAGGFTKYDNVPYNVATAIARSLHQSLEVF